MICKNCGKEFDGRFCPDCGTMVEGTQQELTKCPNCGAERIGGGKFCVSCGYDYVSKKQRKPIDKAKVKKIALRVGIPVIVIAVLLAIIIPTVIWSNNIFRVGKVDKINIGDSQERVVKILGEPYEKSDYRYEYYSKDYVKLLEKIEKQSDIDDWDIDEDTDFDDLEDEFDTIMNLEEELEKMKYQYICVEFDSDKKVSSVFFDADKCDSRSEDENQKQVKSHKLVTKKIIRYEATDIVYTLKMTDGSFYKGIAVNNYISFSYIDTVEWTDSFGNKYREEVKLKESKNILYANKCGENAWYEVHSNGDLIISGYGVVDEEINNTEYSGNQTVKIGRGITELEGKYIYSGVNGTQLFYYPKKVKEVIIEDNSQLTSIGYHAFHYCSSLTSIEIPNSVTSIGSAAFSFCSSLTSIAIPSRESISDLHPTISY